jgi:hypothetical protein
MNVFAPTRIFNKISDIPFELLKEWGIKAILFDIDNTIAPSDDDNLCNDAVTWLMKAKELGFKTFIVSNGRPCRVKLASKKLGNIGYIWPSALKPLKFGFLLAAKRLGVSPTECVMIGDQIFTDIKGANLCHMKTILVDPVDPSTDGFFAKRKRKHEAKYRNA